MPQREYESQIVEIEEMCNFFISQHNIGVDLELLKDQIRSRENIWDRRNWRGHLTASAIVVDALEERCLFFQHKGLNKLLAPGGHCDPFELPQSTAARELKEETGLYADVEVHPWHLTHPYPIDIDSHRIPENTNKREPPHVHHDFRYLFITDSECQFNLNEHEGIWLGWMQMENLAFLYPRVFNIIDSDL